MYINIVPDLCLESQEINRLIQSLDEKGFRELFLQNSISFGLFNNSSNGSWPNFQISQGTNIGTIKNEEGFAVDKDGLIIYRKATDNIDLANDSNWYWIKAAHQYDVREISYQVSVDIHGNLSAPGGNLTEILRGLPNNPSWVTFQGASLNTSEYQVVEVIDDENAVLQGNFLAESNLYLVVRGSFTPGITIPTGSKYPFQYDGCLLTLVQEVSLNTPPALTSGKEFLIARVKRTGSNITIQDKRQLNVYQSKDGYFLSSVAQSSNPLIGIESSRYNNIRSTRAENIVYLAWGMRSSNWTIDSSTNRVTIIGGNGGKYKSTADFTDGDFDGWRIYTKSGKYSTVKQSSISALQINLILDTLNVDEYTDTTQEIHVVPPVEKIEIIAKVPAGQSTLTEKRFEFNINEGEVKILLPVYASTACQYVISYRYKNFLGYSQETLIPDDNAVGYFIETAFNPAGVLIGTAKQTYTSGVITLIENGSSYANIIDTLVSGDIAGVEYLALDNSNPVVDFVVGTRRNYVVITNDNDTSIADGGGPTFTLTGNIYLNFRTDQPGGGIPKNGNEFFLRFYGNYNLNGFSIYLTEDYVSPGNVGHILFQISSTSSYYQDQIANDNLCFRVKFDGNQWLVPNALIHVVDNSVNSNALQSSAVTTAKIAASNVTLSKLDTSTVDTRYALVTQGLWTNVPLNSGAGWQNITRTLQVRQCSLTNLVHLRGDVNSGITSIGAASVIGTLPLAFRPADVVVFNTVVAPQGSSVGYACTLTIATTGDITFATDSGNYGQIIHPVRFWGLSFWQDA